MSNLLIPYLIICLSSLICVILGCKLLHPKYPICIILFYLGYVAFFLGRLYEISRMVLDVELYNSFIITLCRFLLCTMTNDLVKSQQFDGIAPTPCGPCRHQAGLKVHAR